MTTSTQLPQSFQPGLFQRAGHRNHYLFSDYYLNDILRRSPEWKEALKAAETLLPALRQRYQEAQGSLPDYNESQLEDNWFKPILEELGHTIEGQAVIPAPEGGLYKPDFVFFPDNKSRLAAVPKQNSPAYTESALAVGEVKRWDVHLSKKTGPAPTFDDNNPMFQIDAYLRAADLSWGVLSNGRLWRLVHRDSSYKLDVYFEVDLSAVFEDVQTEEQERAALAAAAFFQLFFRRDAFMPDAQGRTFLDRTLQESRDYALALEADLRDNAYRSLEQLIVGFFAANPGLDPQSAADRSRVYQNSLYLLYRLLFLFYGESRALLPMHNRVYARDYSLQGLAKEIDARRNQINDLPGSGRSYWNRLSELFRLISGSDPRLNADLNVPRYNGGLFDPARHAFLETYAAGDRYLAQAIDYLAYRRVREEGQFRGFQSVDYRTLGVRQLGSIYEGLLEYKIAFAQEEMVAVRKSGVDRWIPASERGRSTALDRRLAGELYLQTDKGERKATGSYYTPDYIVKYITEQTLAPLVEAARGRVEERVSAAPPEPVEGEPVEGLPNEAERRRKGAEWFVDEILALNVLDPAMGSGHFLVEATHFLARALATDEYVTIPNGGQKTRFLSSTQNQDSAQEPGYQSAQKPGFSNDDDETDLTYWKRRVVEACIYGVDKNEMAVELGKLSLWLETVAADKPLSFLDHHLRHGDSLVGARLADLEGAPGIRAGTRPAPTEQQVLFDESAFTRSAGLAVGGLMMIERLPTDDIEAVYAKEQAWQEVQETHLARWRRLADLWTSAYFGNEYTPEEYRALAERLQGRETVMTEAQAAQFLNHPTLAENDYFHWELEFPEVFFDEYGRPFGDSAGFDGVIGNPPYIRMESFIALKDLLRQEYFVYETRTDIYAYFVEKALSILAQGKSLGFITSNKWLRSNYGKRLRALLLEKSAISYLINFNDLPVFEATTYPLILITKRTLNKPDSNEFIIVAEIDNLSFTSLADEVERQKNMLQQEILTEDEWNLSSIEQSALIKRLSDKNASLSEHINGLPQMGIKTGLNEAFIVDNSTYNRLIQSEPRSREIIYPLTIGSEIRRYWIDWQQNYLIYCHHGIDISKYPIVKEHLRHYRSHLEGRATRQNWYELQQPQEAYSEQLQKPKIIMPDLAERGRFCLDNDGLFITNTAYFLPTADLYLLALLNSKLITFCLKGITAVFRGGYLRLFGQYLERLPIYRIKFVTGKEERAKKEEKGTKLYDRFCQKDDFDCVLGFVDHHLSQQPEQSDVVHDLLAFLAEQMIAMNKEKQAVTEAFWLDLEGEIENPDTFDALRNKGKWEQSLAKAKALRPFVNPDSRSTRNLDESLGWNEEAFKAFVKMLVKSVPNLSGVVGVYRSHAPHYQTLTRRLAQTDRLIDRIVYRLYNLTEEEIAIIESQ